MRFIDLATDGGCSKKAPAGELTHLLNNLASQASTAFAPGLNLSFADCGTYLLDSVELLSTVDTLFPMVHDPSDFGRIVVNHVLGDIHASFGEPKFALAHLSVPYHLEASNPIITRMMNGALDELANTGVALVGGHTLAKQSDLSLGFSIIATSRRRRSQLIRAPRPGDPIFITKRLGGSGASALWKINAVETEDLADVLAGLLQPSALEARILHDAGLEHCTDITGFGLVNHLHRLLLRQSIAAEIDLTEIPTYNSLDFYLQTGDLPTTSLFFENARFAESFSNASELASHPKAPLLFDAQVAGGLLFTLPAEVVQELNTAFDNLGLCLHAIGHCVAGPAGTILLK